jgi:shikimate kinase
MYEKGHITLLGLMGSGKSTIGERLARALRRPYIDLDARIVAAHGPIAELFTAVGESGFREVEYAILSAALREGPSVIAPGGGIITDPRSRDLLARTTRIYLDVSLPVLVRRLTNSNTLRPLVGSRPTVERVRELWTARHEFYEQAEYRVNGDVSIERVLRAIRVLLEQHGGGVSAEK